MKDYTKQRNDIMRYTDLQIETTVAVYREVLLHGLSTEAATRILTPVVGVKSSLIRNIEHNISCTKGQLLHGNKGSHLTTTVNWFEAFYNACTTQWQRDNTLSAMRDTVKYKGTAKKLVKLINKLT